MPDESITTRQDLETNTCEDLVDTAVLGTVNGSDPEKQTSPPHRVTDPTASFNSPPTDAGVIL